MKVITKLLPIYVENDYYHFGIEAQINGKKAFLLVDTGASRSVIDANKVQNFELLPSEKEEKEENVLGIGGKTILPVSMVLAKKFLIEQYELNRFPFAVIDLNHINQQLIDAGSTPLDGILGNDFLIHAKAVLNFKKLFLQLHLNRSITKDLWHRYGLKK